VEDGGRPPALTRRYVPRSLNAATWPMWRVTVEGAFPGQTEAEVLDWIAENWPIERQEHAEAKSLDLPADGSATPAPTALTPAPADAPLRALLREALDVFPQFDREGDAGEVNGGDLVEWFAAWRQRVKTALDTPPS
jgi:hypothetical protein